MKGKEKNMAITQKEAIEQYINCEIDVYQLADKIGQEYTEIGAFLLANGIRQIDPDALYAIICPNCNKKWLVPRLDKYTCEECQALIEIDYKGLKI